MNTDQGAPSQSHPLDSIFYPKSIAVLGVTPTPDTVPNDIFRNILTSGYTGVLYPVAPFKRSIYAVKAYRYVVDIPDEIDQAVIVYPGNVCHKAVQQCGDKGVKSIIMISAGFREVGPEGAEREKVWNFMVDCHPFYGDYAKATDRVIQAFRLLIGLPRSSSCKLR